MHSQTRTPAPIIDASNCPTRMVFDDASRNLHTAVNNARRAFVREGKIAYVWRPSPALRDQFRHEACEHIYYTMAAQLIDWFDTHRDARKPRVYNLGDSLGLRHMASEQKISDLFADYRLERVDKAIFPFTPYLRATHSSLMAGLGNDNHHVVMKDDGYGRHDRYDKPVHFDVLANVINGYGWFRRRHVDLRVVCVDQKGASQGTRLYDLTADEVGGKDSCDDHGFKQRLIAGHPYLLSQESDVLIIETGIRSMRNAFIHAASPVEPEYMYAPNLENIRMVRTYDFTMPLNRDDVRAQNKLWQAYQ